MTNQDNKDGAKTKKYIKDITKIYFKNNDVTNNKTSLYNTCYHLSFYPLYDWQTVKVSNHL